MKHIPEIFVLFLQLSCKSRIISKGKVKNNLCVCVCRQWRERQKERERENEREREMSRESPEMYGSNQI